MDIRLIDNRIVIGCQTLIKEFGLSKNTIYSGINEYQRLQTYNWESYKSGKDVLVFIDTIPLTTRKKLPDTNKLRALMNGQAHDYQADSIYKTIQYAKLNKFFEHRIYYRDKYGLSAEKTLEVAMKRAAWDRLMQLYSENKIGKKGGLKKGVLDVLHKAYCRIYPDSYTSVQAFIRAIKTVEQRGVDAICIDGRAIKNLEKPALKYDERHLFLLSGIVSSGKAYKSPKIKEILTDMCQVEGIECPSLSWIKGQKVEILKNIEIYNNRYGAERTDKVTPYTGIKPAYFADDQYQIDGWDLPFYYLGEDKRLKKLTLIAVRDAYSRKIVGYSISRSENRQSLFEALQDAVANTGALPFELVSDNHSYNATKEVGYFKEEAEKLGFNWTVDQNPKRKAIAERYFGILGEMFKDCHAYNGQGIKTRDKDGRTKQELIDKYLKSGKILSENGIVVIAMSVIDKFNKTPLNGTRKSPEQLYAESTKPHRIEIDLYERLRLFTKKTEYKVSRGQINITIAGALYQYQLPADLFAKYNGIKVCVRYDTLETIYLFDLHTDKPICALEQKEMAAGALANQTEEDMEILNRSTGRIKGIKAQARKQNEEIAEKAALRSPGIFETLNSRLTPKDVLKIAEEEYVVKEAAKRGIDLNRLESVQVFSEVENPAFTGRKQSRKEKSPFAPDTHKITTIELED